MSNIQPIIDDAGVPRCTTACRHHHIEMRPITSEHRCRWFSLRGRIVGQFCEPALRALAKDRKALLAALRDIAEMTDPDNPDSYRSDDREGCLDTVHAKATAAIAAAEPTPSAEADSPA